MVGGHFLFLGVLGVILSFITFFDEISLSKETSPRWDAAFCGVTFGAILFAYVPQKGRQAYIRLKSLFQLSIDFCQRLIISQHGIVSINN